MFLAIIARTFSPNNFLQQYPLPSIMRHFCYLPNINFIKSHSAFEKYFKSFPFSWKNNTIFPFLSTFLHSVSSIILSKWSERVLNLWIYRTKVYSSFAEIYGLWRWIHFILTTPFWNKTVVLPTMLCYFLNYYFW